MGNRIVNEDGSVNMGIPLGAVFGCQTLCYLFCQAVKDNGWIDVMWGLSFIVPNACILGAKLALG